MGDRKYVVPTDMALAAWVEMSSHAKVHGRAVGCQVGSMCSLDSGLQAAVKWLAENPIIPTHKQIQDIADSNIYYTEMVAKWIAEWQRRMFLAPDPEIPEDIKDMLIPIRNMDEAHGRISGTTCAEYNHAIVDAYNRGRKSKG